MKIVICIHSLGNGGAERVSALWAEGFLRKGSEVHLVTTMRDENIEYVKPENNYVLPKEVEIHDLSAPGNALLRYIRKIVNLRRLLRCVHPDVAIAVLMPWDFWLLIASFGLKIPVVNTEHDSFERPKSAPMSKRQWFHKFVLNHFFRGVTVLNEADRKVAGKSFSNMYVMPNPLSFNPLDEVPKKEKVIFAAGRLDCWHYKGFDKLLMAWGAIAYKHKEWKLYIAGAGAKKDVDFLSDIAKSFNVLDQVKFLGFQRNIVSFFKKSEIFVLSSRYEGFGLVLIEAMSQGCACLACDYKGRQREIITNDNEGLLCQPDDEKALAEGLELLISDEALRHKLQQNAIERSKFYMVDKVIERWYNLFEKLSIKCKE